MRKARSATLKAFARNLRRLRTERGLSQERLAEMADLARETVSQLERSKENISLYGIDSLAVALRCQPYDLLKPDK